MSNEAVLGAVFVVAGVVALALPSVRKRLSSMRVGVGLLAVMAALSLLGVLIGQGLPPEAYLDRFGAGLGELIIRSGLYSVFHTWYFLLAVWALALSLLSCSFRRIVGLVRSKDGARIRVASLGSLITHLSLILVLAGGVVTAALGFRRVDDRFLGAGDTTEVPEGGFSIRVLEARTEFTEAGRLSEYVSVVGITEDGEDEGPYRIEVNQPLTRNGVGVFQYEMLPAPDSVESVLLGVATSDPGGGRAPFELRVPFRKEAEIPGTGLTVKALAFYSDFTYDIETGTAGLKSIWHDNPAVFVQVSAAGATIFERWLFPGLRGHADEEDLPIRLRFLDYEPDFRNGLTRFEYSRQPGTPLLFTGLAALSVGMCAILWFGARGRNVS